MQLQLFILNLLLQMCFINNILWNISVTIKSKIIYRYATIVGSSWRFNDTSNGIIYYKEPKINWKNII